MFPVGPVAAAGQLWRTRGELQLTVIVQARLGLRHDRMMAVLAPGELASRDVHRDGDPTRSLLRPADLVPFRPRVDVWMTGHARAPRPVGVALVRLAVYRGDERALDKVVVVRGDRDPDGAPAPFTAMPLIYERAYGSSTCDANPVGTAWPNLVHADEAETPGCFGPIARYWKARRRHLPREHQLGLRRAVPEIPPDFEWRYFQAAPEDQQLEHLVGDEWLVLDGIDAASLRLQTRLPKIRGVARLFRDAGDPGDSIALAADTLGIDADADEACVTWRGIVRIAHGDELATLRVAAGVEHVETTVDWEDVARAIAHEPSVLEQLDPEVLDELRRDALVSAPEPDLLARTTIDAVRDEPDDLTRTAQDGLPAVRLDPGETAPVPLAADRPTQPGLAHRPWDEVEDSDDTAAHRFADLEDSDPDPTEGVPPVGTTARRPQSETSLAPPPLDRAAHAALLRAAGATDGDIAAFERFLEDV